METMMRRRKDASAAETGEMRGEGGTQGMVLTDCLTHIVPLYFFHAGAEVAEFDDGLVQDLLHER